MQWDITVSYTHLDVYKRQIVFMAAPPAVGKTTLCEFLEYLSKQDQEFTDIQALGLDGFHYHSDYILSLIHISVKD